MLWPACCAWLAGEEADFSTTVVTHLIYSDQAFGVVGLQRFQFWMSYEALQDRVIGVMADGNSDAYGFRPPRLSHQLAQADTDIVRRLAVGEENKDRRQPLLGHNIWVKLLRNQLQGFSHIGNAVCLQINPVKLFNLHSIGYVPTGAAGELSRRVPSLRRWDFRLRPPSCRAAHCG